MDSSWILVVAGVALVVLSQVHAETAQSESSDPVGTIDLSGFDPVEQPQQYATWQTDDGRIYKIFEPRPTSVAAITKDGTLREFRYWCNSRSGMVDVQFLLLKEDPANSANLIVSLLAQNAEVGSEDEEVWLEQLAADMWESSQDNRVEAGMLLAASVEKGCKNGDTNGGVSYALGSEAQCGRTYTYKGDFSLGTSVPKSELFASRDAQCMMASMQVVVDL